MRRSSVLLVALCASAAWGVEIYEIQGTGASSPVIGQTVQTSDNVVTGVANSGFFIQTPDERDDRNDGTSNGLFVFTTTRPSVARGDRVSVAGRVAEAFGMTELSGSVTYTSTGSGSVLPAIVDLQPAFSDFERLEGMLVRVVDGLAAAGTDRFGSTKVVAGTSRPFRSQGLHPEIFEVDPTAQGGAPPVIYGGANIARAEGPLAYAFNDYVIWTNVLEFTNPTLPRAVRPRIANEMTVGTQNLLRLFDKDPAYQARLTALSTHIREILGAPDVVAVQEVENQVTLDDLASRLTADGVKYSAFVLEGNDIGGIDVGFLVRDSVHVETVEQLGKNDMFNGFPLNDRPPLLLRATYSSFVFSVIAVHQRSLIDVETSETVRAKRREQATRLADYVRALDPQRPLIVIGDFNAFEFDDGYVDVMGIVTGARLTNQVLRVSPSNRYSYVEDGMSQVLDHALTSAAMNPFVREMQFARGNADAPVTSAQVSDHDGAVLFVATDGPIRVAPRRRAVQH